MKARGWKLRGAYASPVLVSASRRNELRDAHSLNKSSAPEELAEASSWCGGRARDWSAVGRSFRRDAETITRDAYAPRNSRPQISREEVRP